MVAAVAAALACVPTPGLGTIRYERGTTLHVVDLATCRETASRVPRPRGNGVTVAVAGGKQTLRADGRALLTLPAWKPNAKNGSPGPIMPLGRAARWVLYAIDSMGSASLIADGVLVRAVSPAGRIRAVTTALGYSDYRTWCGGRLVLIAGGDRIATRNKRIVAARPPDWKPVPLVRGADRAWGSVACAPDGRSVVAQAQPPSDDATFVRTRWALWRVGFDGSLRRLTSPPPGYADESPRVARDGTLYFVRSRRGVGRLYALRRGALLGPLLSLGYSLGYYGHRAWPYSVTR